MSLQPALYLIPVNISDAPLRNVLPAENLELINHIKFFIVENVRTARRFLKRCNREINIDELTFFELNQHTDVRDIPSFLQPLRDGMPMGVMSEAGCPAVADPGASAVAIAQREGFKVVPLVGPSSILMSLMASGFNGQGFAFHGYLPIESKQRVAAIRRLETEAARNDTTQIFIEAPYRNSKLLALLCDTLSANTPICVARDISDTENELIVTLPASKWKKKLTEIQIDKHPTIFLIYHA